MKLGFSLGIIFAVAASSAAFANEGSTETQCTRVSCECNPLSWEDILLSDTCKTKADGSCSGTCYFEAWEHGPGEKPKKYERACGAE